MNPLAVSAVGGIIGTIGNVIDDLVTTDKERMDAQIELAKIDASLLTAQMEVFQSTPVITDGRTLATVRPHNER